MSDSLLLFFFSTFYAFVPSADSCHIFTALFLSLPAFFHPFFPLFFFLLPHSFLLSPALDLHVHILSPQCCSGRWRDGKITQGFDVPLVMTPERPGRAVPMGRGERDGAEAKGQEKRRSGSDRVTGKGGKMDYRREITVLY